MAAIELQGITKTFVAKGRATEVLRGIDLTVADGEFVVFVGPSGCGKSTLLRTIAGLEGASAGRVLLAGRDVSDERPGDRGLAMVFQSYALYPHMTVRQNLGFGMRMRGVPAATVAAKLERAVRLLELGPFLERRPGELSGGQCQRVAIGRAIVQEPAAFLFDEPLSNLDAELRLRMRLEIAALHRELGTTMVYVTHDQVEAMTLAQRIVVLRAGRIEQLGAPMDLYDRPANTFVAGFIGAPAMNLLPRAAAPGLAAPPDAATLGVRPEHLQSAPDGPLALEVRGIERLGASTWLHGVLAGSTTPLSAELREAPAGLGPGARMRFVPLPGRVHAFDGTGQRIEDHAA